MVLAVVGAVAVAAVVVVAVAAVVGSVEFRWA